MSLLAATPDEAQIAKQQQLEKQRRYHNFIAFIKDDVWPFIQEEGYATDAMRDKTTTFIQANPVISFPVFEKAVIIPLQDEALHLAEVGDLVLGGDTVLWKTLDQIYRQRAVRHKCDMVEHLNQTAALDKVIAFLNAMGLKLREYLESKSSVEAKENLFGPFFGQTNALVDLLNESMLLLNNYAQGPESWREEDGWVPMTNIDWKVIKKLWLALKTIRYLCWFMLAC
jgi:hypothetical protein